MGDEITIDAMCDNAHKTYNNLTQASLGRQLKLKIAADGKIEDKNKYNFQNQNVDNKAAETAESETS